MRALIGAFAQGNPTQFNRADGAGYDFVADNVLALDPKNPQLAARLATAFRTWRTLEAGRRAQGASRAASASRPRPICRAISPTSSNARSASALKRRGTSVFRRLAAAAYPLSGRELSVGNVF